MFKLNDSLIPLEIGNQGTMQFKAAFCYTTFGNELCY